MSASLPFPKSAEPKEEFDLTLLSAPFLPRGQAVSPWSARWRRRRGPCT